MVGFFIVSAGPEVSDQQEDLLHLVPKMICRYSTMSIIGLRKLLVFSVCEAVDLPFHGIEDSQQTRDVLIRIYATRLKRLVTVSLCQKICCEQSTLDRREMTADEQPFRLFRNVPYAVLDGPVGNSEFAVL